MAKNIHKGTELNNVQETWNENERRSGAAADRTGDPGTVREDLKQVISDEAAEYDRQNRENNIMGGDRATVRDGED